MILTKHFVELIKCAAPTEMRVELYSGELNPPFNFISVLVDGMGYTIDAREAAKYIFQNVVVASPYTPDPCDLDCLDH